MDELSGYFASPVWWFSVVAVGAAVNVLTMIGMMLNADFDFDRECIHVAS